MNKIPRLPLGANRLPCVTRMQLDSACEQVIRCFDPDILKHPHPLDVDALAECFLELAVDYMHLTSDGSTLGAMIFETGYIPYYDMEKGQADCVRVEENTVLIEADLLHRDQACRYRFTMAHECSHALWHGPYFCAPEQKVEPYACRTTDIFGNPVNDERLLSDYRWMEWQANKSASALLMPRTSVLQLLDMAALRCSNLREQAELIRLMRREYGVSEEAAFYRLKDLGCRMIPVETAKLNMVYGSWFLRPQLQKDRI